MKIVFNFCLVIALLIPAVNVWAGLFNKNVEADPNKEYRLSETDGPWLILVTSFAGPTGQQDANALVFDLRKNHKLNAFQYEKTFVHDINKDFERVQNPLSRNVKKYQTQGSVQEYVVVVGNFQSMDEKSFKETLEKVKKCNPASLKPNPMLKRQPTEPFIRAFGCANPLLPPENQRGTVDKFIESINIKRPYTLLRNPRRYTVQIATFTGHVVIKQDEINAIENGKQQFSKRKVSELELGEKAAVKLCQTLRDQGIEAYEFHDRYASIVTVGSFDSYGRKYPNGLEEMDPQILQIIQRYQGKPVSGQMVSYEPVRIGGIECDVQPKVIEVPRCQRR
ncbi:hypothetical protein FACS1894189_1750 [Planctomycetales bacterium]|nr:hypothetical protein FACS1894189_1750 [Planctomycetales bacterium]